MYLENINGPEDVKKLSLEERKHWQKKCVERSLREPASTADILVLTLVWWKRPLLSTMCLSPQR